MRNKIILISIILGIIFGRLSAEIEIFQGKTIIMAYVENIIGGIVMFYIFICIFIILSKK